MVTQYPYKLFKLTKSEATYNPETGEWGQGAESWDFISNCRDENNSSGKSITTDGVVYVYGALIQMPFGRYPIQDGDRIRIEGTEGETRLEADIKGFAFKQLHSQIWV